ncbi:MAG: hypothetical protein IJ770_00190 [Alphaproteobacteria bacterium]|nr:hypothetical protein [Alphaproteobacteria bacterium]
MSKIFMIAMGILLLTVWLGFLVPQYAACKNRCYKTVAICLSSFVVSVAAFVAMMIYGDFITALLYGAANSRTAQADEFILCLLAFVWVVGHFFCWWYIYGRKSLDFIHFKGYTADDLEKIISPEFKKILGLE